MTDAAFYRLRMIRWRPVTYPGGHELPAQAVGKPVFWVSGRQDYGPTDLATAAADYATWRNNPSADLVEAQKRSGQPVLPTVSIRTGDQTFADVTGGHDSWLLTLVPTPAIGPAPEVPEGS